MRFTDERPMSEQIEDKLADLEKIPTEAIAKSSPEFPGAFLKEHHAVMVDRNEEGYANLVAEYDKFRPELLKGLAENPTTRALALLAVGQDGVDLMEQGKVPRHEVGSYTDRRGQERKKFEYYNCHHIFQKSAIDLDLQQNGMEPGQEVNAARNLVLINTFASEGGSKNAHHYFHGAILHPETNLPAGSEMDMFVVKPAFPIYPPCTEAFTSPEEVHAALAKIDPSAQLPQEWAERIVAFSEALGHKPFEVPKEYREVTQAFGAIYFSKDPDKQIEARDRAAEKGAQIAADHLPAGATLMGVNLPEDHVPSKPIPIVDGEGNVTWPKGVTEADRLSPTPAEPAYEAVTVQGYFEKGNNQGSSYVAVITGESEKFGFDRTFVDPSHIEYEGQKGQGASRGIKTFEIPEGVIVETKLVPEKGARAERDFLKVEDGEVRHLTKAEVLAELKQGASKSKGISMPEESHSEEYSVKV